MSFDKDELYNDTKVLMEISGEYHGTDLTAYCGADTEGRTFLLSGDLDLETEVGKKFGAPFPPDIVIHDDRHPRPEEMKKIRDELGTEFDIQFSDTVDNIYNEIKDSDDPVETILGMEADDIQP